MPQAVLSNSSESSLLIVDDNPTNLSVLCDALESAGHNVRVASSGSMALTSIQHAAPDLILLDVMMPGMDGFTVCRELKANPETADIPVIFMTALTDTVDEVTGLRLGAVDYIAKPFKVEIVIARVQTQLTLRRLQLQLKRQNADLDAYARMVAHDLKNPLSAIVSTSKFLVAMGDMQTAQDIDSYLRVILSAGQRAVTTINELLALAHSRQESVHVSQLDMGVIVQTACEQLASMIEEYGAQITTPHTWPAALGYAPWIELVWVNYLSNSIKYGGQPPSVELGATVGNTTIQFWIEDNGHGLLEHERAQLFQEFTRLHQNSATGHGLGLSIVRRIIERLGGTVGVEPGIHGGSRFFFTLPTAA